MWSTLVFVENLIFVCFSSSQMVTPTKVLLDVLNDLSADDFKTFKWFLKQKEDLGPFRPIPERRLEDADRTDTVDAMKNLYGTHTVEVTRTVLVQINRNDLLEELPKPIN
uniref:Pyrin domain-containing protein n=1 Tax=Sphaeramia orbicularis TaxID=375764 RepID=A0A672YU26_9TELE